MKTQKLSRGIIETQIIKHYTESFDPQETKLDFECEFTHIEGFFELTFIVPYSTSLIGIYEDDEIDCTCGVLDVELILTPDLSQDPDAMPLYKKIQAIEENQTEEYEKEAYELRQEDLHND